MKTFRELYFKVDSSQTDEFIRALDVSLVDGWTRAHDAEERGKETNITGEQFFYYYCNRNSKREAAMVAIYRRDSETLTVTNVVPRELSELNFDQHNNILSDFHDNILAKLPKSFQIVFASDKLDIQKLMSPRAFERLCAFSTTASKSTGSAHPSDRQAWYSFLITLHQTKHYLDSHSLMRWLTEVQNWPNQAAHDLGIEFEFAVGLLECLET